MRKIADLFYKKPFLLFLLFLIVAYLPVLLPYFHLKNDLLTQNLPTRFVFGESLYSGFEPFWNPYLHYGSPQYGDMNNGFWNPVQWLIGSFFGYSIYTITFEELFYIIIGGWGIYKVCKEFFSKDVAIITGLTYMCCGYLTGHLQYLCWITGTAYFPFVLLYFVRINKNPVARNFLLGGVAVFFFAASTHPGLIIGSAYFFVFALLMIYSNRKGILQNLYQPNFWLINFLFLIIGCLLSVIVIVSNVEVLQYISRGSKVSLEQTLMAPTTLHSYLSIYFPLAVHKSDLFNTDIAMRNVYIGLAHLTGLFLIARLCTKRILITFSVPLLFFILLAAGSYFKIFAWNFLPLTGYVRLNGEFTYFVILLLLLYGSAGIQKIVANKIAWPSKLFTYLTGATLLVAILSVAFILINKSSLIYANNTGSSSFKEIIKSLIDNSSIWDLLLIQAVIQIITLSFIRNFKNQKVVLGLILSLNLILITWLTLPFTGLGMMSKKEVQSVLNTFPKGIQTQPLVAINNADYIKPADESQFLLIASYSKKIGSPLPDQYPVQLRSNNDFISDNSLFNFIQKQSWLFLSDDTILNTRTNFDSANIIVHSSGPGLVKCTINNTDYKWLTLLQNDYKYWEVEVDGKPVKHFKGFKTFISVPMERGQHKVSFRFKPTKIKTLAYLNVILLLISLTIALIPRLGKIKIFK